MPPAADLACLIAEPIQGVGGFAVPPDGFFGAMKKELDNRGILFIADEVQTGWGRTGDHFWGYEAHGVTPDLLTFAKGLGNGTAIAGVAGRAEVIDCLPANAISTFGGNPVSCAAALASWDIIERENLLAHVREIAPYLQQQLRTLRDIPLVGDVRGTGLMAAVTAPGAATAVGVSGIDLPSIPSQLLVFFVIYFVLGFLLYGTLYAGIGAAFDTEQEAQNFQGVITMFLVVPLVLMMYILNQPDAPLSVALSLFPFFTPMLMFLRMTLTQVPAIQLVASVVLMVLLLAVCSDAFLLPGGSKGPGAVARVSQSIRQWV